MSMQTTIEWTERTWNPVIGCHKVSAGCKHCYAETLSRRLMAMGANGYDQPFADIRLMRDRLDQPRRVRKSSMWFVNSMSDLFQPRVPFSFIDQVFETIDETPRHTYQILTKRPGRMAQYFSSRKVPPNAWLGTSVENRRHGLPRIDALRRIQARVLFLSAEPLLEDLGELDLSGIHWVIVGGESGRGARRMHPDWVANIHRSCRDYKAAFFFKQWGAVSYDGERRSKKANGRTWLGSTWNEMPSTDAA